LYETAHRAADGIKAYMEVKQCSFGLWLPTGVLLPPPDSPVKEISQQEAGRVLSAVIRRGRKGIGEGDVRTVEAR
jgi:hypothetical protein